jgi:hyperpolarization activated cyclic nucleotide-gated potassium channel 1
MHKGAAKQVPFFMGRDMTFISKIVPFLINVHSAPMDIIYSEDDYADEIYFIVDGRVDYVFGPDNTTFKSMQRGSYFGEIEVIK